MKVDPAHTIIRFLGGANRVAMILNCDATRIYRWEYPAGRNEGKDGLIPPKDARKLLEYAEAEEIDLRPEDFFDASRLREQLEETVAPTPEQAA